MTDHDTHQEEDETMITLPAVEYEAMEEQLELALKATKLNHEKWLEAKADYQRLSESLEEEESRYANLRQSFTMAVKGRSDLVAKLNAAEAEVKELQAELRKEIDKQRGSDDIDWNIPGSVGWSLPTEEMSRSEIREKLGLPDDDPMLAAKETIPAGDEHHFFTGGWMDDDRYDDLNWMRHSVRILADENTALKLERSQLKGDILESEKDVAYLHHAVTVNRERSVELEQMLQASRKTVNHYKDSHELMFDRLAAEKTRMSSFASSLDRQLEMRNLRCITDLDIHNNRISAKVVDLDREDD